MIKTLRGGSSSGVTLWVVPIPVALWPWAQQAAVSSWGMARRSIDRQLFKMDNITFHRLFFRDLKSCVQKVNSVSNFIKTLYTLSRNK